MKKQFLFFIIVIIYSHSFLYAQQHDSLFQRLQAISNSGLDFFNVDGIEITSQTINLEFSKKSILKKFKKFSIKESDLTSSDSSILSQNYYVSKSEEIAAGTVQHSSYYFIENKSMSFTAITFSDINKSDKAFENKFVALIINGEIPKSVYTPLEIDSINFAGRKIALGKSCHWMGINNVQCPYYGQMNWSVHKTLEDASESVNNQYTVIKIKKLGSVPVQEIERGGK